MVRIKNRMADRCRLLCLIIVAGFCLAILPYSTQADDTSLGAIGYGVVPMDNDQVTMAAERVKAEIRGDQAWVTCVFTFTNTGPTVEVLMGFPQARSIVGGESELMDFRAFVDEEAVSTIFRPNARPQGDWDYAGWHTFNVSFAAGQTRVVRNTYHGRLNLVSNGDRAFEYILHTGATWHDSIGQADVIVRWQKDRDVRPETISASPPGYLQGHHELRWHFTNLEPTLEDDIRVFFRPVYGPFNLDSATASSGKVQPAQTGHGLPAAFFLTAIRLLPGNRRARQREPGSSGATTATLTTPLLLWDWASCRGWPETGTLFRRMAGLRRCWCVWLS